MAIKNNQLTSLKSGNELKYLKNQFQLNKSINNYRTKTSHHFIKRKKKESESLNFINNSNVIEKSLEKSDNIQNNNMVNNQTEKSFKIDKSLWEEKEKRKIIANPPLNLSHKLSSIKLSLSKRKNKLPLYSIYDDINNNLLLNYRINSEDKIEKSEETFFNTEKEINTYNYYKTNKINVNNNDIKEKCYKNLTEGNNNKNQNSKFFQNLFFKTNSRNGNIIYSKNKSYDDSKNILSKIKLIKEKIINFYPCTYIRVNKNHVNKIKSIDQNINKKNNNLYNNINNNKSFNNKTITIEKLHNNKSQKLINLKKKTDYNSNYNDKKTKLLKKASKTTFDNNNNIFLDKTYQNRFKYKPNYNKLKRDIFTNDKQKEYNTIVVKKRNNYLNSIITISTTISSNSSNNNTGNIYNKNWVHRLYDEEIQKQKKRNKLIYSIRKSILRNSSYNKPKKQLNKSNTVKDFNLNEYTNNFNKDFNIINLFISDEKKNKKKIKKQKKKNYIYSDNNKNENENNDEDNKVKAIRHKRRSKSKYKKAQKNFIYIDEELINEEDEEKEIDEDEK